MEPTRALLWNGLTRYLPLKTSVWAPFQHWSTKCGKMLAKIQNFILSIYGKGRHPKSADGLVFWFAPPNQCVRGGPPKTEEIKSRNQVQLFQKWCFRVSKFNLETFPQGNSFKLKTCRSEKTSRLKAWFAICFCSTPRNKCQEGCKSCRVV